MHIIELPSPTHEDRAPGSAIDMLLLHYTGMQSGAEAIERLRDPAPPTGIRVSSHYVVEEDGRVFRLVPEARRAAHAGISFWRGHTVLNNRTIGIEIVNPGHEWGYRDFPAAQMAAVQELCLGILARHPIPARNVIAHSDVAPDRKQDPGERFPWRDLAQNGVGLWADVPDLGTGASDDAGQTRDWLTTIGYRPDLDLDIVLRAFQRHWRPEAVNGLADAGTCARLQALVGLLATSLD